MNSTHQMLRGSNQTLEKTMEKMLEKLSFEPRRAWPESLPAIAWNQIQLCGFHKTEVHKILFSQSEEANREHFIQTLVDLFPTLTLTECMYLFYSLQEVKVKNILQNYFNLDSLWIPLMQKYQMRFSSTLLQTFEALKEAPKEFQDWCNKKELGARDLSALQLKNQILNPSHYDLALKTIAQLDFGKSEGVKALEMSLELLSQDISHESVFSKEITSSAQKWLSHLTKLRYPMSTQYDLEQNYKVAKLSWPTGTYAKWVRVGDMGTLEVKIQSTSTLEFKKILSGLKKVEEQMEQSENKIWLS